MKSPRHPAGYRRCVVEAAAALLASLCAATAVAQSPQLPVPAAQQALKFYELRTYYAAPGKIKDLMEEFRFWVMPALVKVGMTPVAFWSKEGEADGAVVYLLAFASRQERDAAWERFRADPEVRARLAANAKQPAPGVVRPIARVEEAFMTMTGFSPHPRTAAGIELE